MTAELIRVLIVDDHEVVREGLANYLRQCEGVLFVGQANNGLEGVALCQELAPHVVLMDLEMPRLDGVSATQQIKALTPAVQVVILTSFGDEGHVQEALKAGAIGYLLKNASLQEMRRAIHDAHAGKSTLSPEAARALISAQTRPATPGYNLKPRELEVLALMVEGLTNAQIAQKLNLSISTIKFHVSAILAKLGVESRTEAVAVALQNNLINS